MFYKRDLYPNLGNSDTTEKTLPDFQERKAYTERTTLAEAGVNAGNVPIWMIVLGGILLVLILGGK